MDRYLVFGGRIFYPAKGWSDFKASYSTIQDFYEVFSWLNFPKENSYIRYKLATKDNYNNEWFQLVDLEQNKVVAWNLKSLEELVYKEITNQLKIELEQVLKSTK